VTVLDPVGGGARAASPRRDFCAANRIHTVFAAFSGTTRSNASTSDWALKMQREIYSLVMWAGTLAGTQYSEGQFPQEGSLIFAVNGFSDLINHTLV